MPRGAARRKRGPKWRHGTDLLDAWLRDSGSRQRELSIVVGVDEATISRWRHGLRTPTLDGAMLLETATGIPATAWLKVA